jgi:hypothetical protein
MFVITLKKTHEPVFGITLFIDILTNPSILPSTKHRISFPARPQKASQKAHPDFTMTATKAFRAQIVYPLVSPPIYLPHQQI